MLVRLPDCFRKAYKGLCWLLRTSVGGAHIEHGGEFDQLYWLLRISVRKSAAWRNSIWYFEV